MIMDNNGYHLGCIHFVAGMLLLTFLHLIVSGCWKEKNPSRSRQYRYRGSWWSFEAVVWLLHTNSHRKWHQSFQAISDHSLERASCTVCWMSNRDSTCCCRKRWQESQKYRWKDWAFQIFCWSSYPSHCCSCFWSCPEKSKNPSWLWSYW